MMNAAAAMPLGANVTAALAIQPAAHGTDHSYCEHAASRPRNGGNFSFKGMWLPASAALYGEDAAGPRGGAAPEDDHAADRAEQALRAYHAKHQNRFVGLRFNPGLFGPEGLASPIAARLFSVAGELGWVVGLMAFQGGMGAYAEQLGRLMDESPRTVVVIDHFGFFRQPAFGGEIEDDHVFAENDRAPDGNPLLSGEEELKKLFPDWLAHLHDEIVPNAVNGTILLSEHAKTALTREFASALSHKNDEKGFEALLALGFRFPHTLFVKLSAFFRCSRTAFPHYDLRPRVLALLRVFGADRLMWGSDFPFVLLGGHTFAEGMAVPYERCVAVFDEWNQQARRTASEGEDRVLEIAETALEWIMAGTAERVFGKFQ